MSILKSIIKRYAKRIDSASSRQQPNHFGVPDITTPPSYPTSEAVVFQQTHSGFEINGQLYRFSVRPSDSVNVEISSFLVGDFEMVDAPSRAALAAFRFVDAEGNTVIPLDNTPIGPAVGPYIYLSGDSSTPKTTQVVLQVPPNANSLEITLKKWRKELTAYASHPPIVSILEGATHESQIDHVSSALSALGANDNLTVIYSTSPLMSHPSLGLRPNRLAREMERRGHTVFFLPFGRVANSEIRYSEKIWQFPRDILPEIFDAIAASKHGNVTFICSSFPDIQAVCAIDLANTYGWNTLYEVRDDMEEFNRVGYSKWYRARLENYVCRKAKYITTVSPRLATKMIENGAEPQKVAVIPNGVEAGFVQSTEKLRALDTLNSRRSSSIIGYIGHLTPSWFDWNLIISTAVHRPEWTFEIIGHGAPGNLDLPQNVILLGPKTHEEFIEISQRWRIGMIPFKPSKLTYGVDPNKLYEYLAVGLPVISAPMGSVDASPLTFVYQSRSEFSQGIEYLFNQHYDHSTVLDLNQYVDNSKWASRLDATLKFIQVA
ncbi:glycosyltransferase [Brucella intermedia]|uniref:glycosyltransferase n=1 Tax=Brucella intermedia TaxID=94625 RepID=UPI00224B512F|nr:glycosyltransferase [Brucella intermedia]